MLARAQSREGDERQRQKMKGGKERYTGSNA